MCFKDSFIHAMMILDARQYFMIMIVSYSSLALNQCWLRLGTNLMSKKDRQSYCISNTKCNTCHFNARVFPIIGINLMLVALLAPDARQTMISKHIVIVLPDKQHHLILPRLDHNPDIVAATTSFYTKQL